ncbi:MAG: ferrous iron transport protein B [Firmicutes bacterium]|nr:ferrous iron transport protein B [Bacillota bacterium]
MAGRVLLLGNPNVGKSAVFNALTGGRATVSNYPGTTVEMLQGFLKGVSACIQVTDTPGMYSIVPVTEEERIAVRETLTATENTVVVQVGDAKNLERTLALTLQILDLRIPLVLVLNMMDEAESAGISIHSDALSGCLGIPVVTTSAVSGRGIEDLRNVIIGSLETVWLGRPCGCISTGVSCAAAALWGPVELEGQDSGAGPGGEAGEALQQAKSMLEALSRYFESRAPGRGRLYASVYLEGGRDGLAGVLDEATLVAARDTVGDIDPQQAEQIALILAGARHARARELARQAQACTAEDDGARGPAASGRALPKTVPDIDRVLIHPLLGFVPLVAVVYFGLYLLVGKLGAGVVVDFIDSGLFERFVTPRATTAVGAFPDLARDLLAGDYGLLTVALRYAFAIIMPIVGTFFIAFALIEDSGYLPRMALLLDSWFRRLGLNGRAVIPIVLGFGCDTMATVVTRTLETRRERLIATVILALAIPCSAQLGLIMAILSPQPVALLLWALVVFAVLVTVGTMAARLLPGDPPGFFMELPPLRVPRLANILSKSWARMTWYVLEVIPVFAGMSVVLTLADRFGVLERVITVIGPLMSSMGLPAAAAEVFIYGFFRRDYGAAGLYDLARAGVLSTNQILIAAVVLTLFVPCIAQFTVMMRERGVTATLAISAFVTLCAAGVGIVLNAAMGALGVVL